MSRSHTGRQYEPHIQDGESADALIAGSVDDLERSQSHRSAVVDPRPRDYDRHDQRRAISSIDAKDQSAIGIFPHVRRAIFPCMGVRVDTHPHPVAKPFSSQIPTLTSGRILMIDDPMYSKSRATSDRFTNIDIRETLDVADYEGTTDVDLLREASADRPSGKSIDVRLFPTLNNAFADLSERLSMRPLPPAASPPLRSNKIRRSTLKSSPTIRPPLGPTPGAR